MQISPSDSAQKQQSEKSLIISNKEKQPLSSAQLAFNRLIKKIEKLRLGLKKTSDDLDQKLDYYAKHVYKAERELLVTRKELVKLVFSFYHNEKLLSKTEKKALKGFFGLQLNEILFFEENPDEELKKIFEEINGVEFERAGDIEFDLIKNDMEDLFNDFGFDIDLTDFKKDMTAEEMMAKMNTVQEEFLKQEEIRNSKKASRKKTIKQREKEEKLKELEEARRKNISGIYKQLAKALHPDLEKDEDVKKQKEELMKRLTNAYNSRDLHAMLSLEMEWIHKEEKDIAKLSKEKLGVYNQVLKEQVQELERQKFELMQHPRYQPLRRYSFSPSTNVNLPMEKRLLEEMKTFMLQIIVNLKGDNYLKELKAIVREFKNKQQEDDFIFDYMALEYN